MSTSPAPPASLRFGRFELRPLEHRLLADGEPVPLGGRAFDLLLALVRRPGELLTRNELIEQVWPGRVVEENNLSVQVNTLRKLLGGEWLATVPGRGYRFIAPQEAARPADAAAAGAADLSPRLRTNLPALQPLLIGRSDDLAALGTLIDQHRLVTIVGSGGMGKTRLAQALLHLRASAYAQGVCWVELGGMSAPEALSGAVAAALGLQMPPGDAPGHLARAVSGLRMLLALDNAEHLLDDVALLAQALLDAAPGLCLVVTSQAPLRLAGERVLRLGPLAVPQGVLPAQQAQVFGAVALFCERAVAADHRFVLRDADVPAVIELCRRLDGVALAIELAAARAPVLGVQRLLQGLSDRLRLLNSNRDRHAPSRQQSLRAALDWSVGLLAPAEQQLFRRLAVLAGPASMDLVQQVGSRAPSAARGDAWEVVDALDQLAQRSLVEAQTGEDEGLPRYRLLESPRALAWELLEASGETDAVRLRHAQGVLDEFAANRAALHAGEMGMRDWHRRAENDLGNAREALAWLAAGGLPGLELALASAMLQLVLNDERLILADRCERLIADGAAAGTALDRAAVARAWREISIALANLRPARSLEAGRQALALARQLDTPQGDRHPLYDALCGVAHMVVDDDADEAERLLHEALAIEDPAWSAFRQRPGLRVRASIATARGQAAEALRLYRGLQHADRASGQVSLVTLLNIADAELVLGDAAAAVATGTRLVSMLRDRRDENFKLFARVNLAAAHLALGQTAAARQLLQDAWAAPARPRMQAWCIDFLALLAALEGRAQAAAQLLGAADHRHERGGGQRQINEQRAHERTLGLIGGALDAAALAALRRQGSALGDADVLQLGLATT